MRGRDAFGQWVFKTWMFIGSVAVAGLGIAYFVSGGPLLVEESVPLLALASICVVPLGALGMIGAVQLIIDTEKKAEPTTHEKFLTKYSAE